MAWFHTTQRLDAEFVVFTDVFVNSTVYREPTPLTGILRIASVCPAEVSSHFRVVTAADSAAVLCEPRYGLKLDAWLIVALVRVKARRSCVLHGYRFLYPGVGMRVVCVRVVLHGLQAVNSNGSQN